MSLQPQYERDSEIPSVPWQLDESTSEHVVRTVEESVDDDEPSVLTVGFRQSEPTRGSLEVVLETIDALRENDVRVTAFDAETIADVVADSDDSPTDCYDAIVLFEPLHRVDELSVGDLVSDRTPDQLVVDLTGTMEPASVADRDSTCITYRVP